MRELFFLVVIGMCGSGFSADWPGFRGPHGDGVSAETELADNWPAEGPPVVWTRELGAGYSGFAVANGRVFTQGQNLYQQYVECLDALTGETRWRHYYGLPFDGGSYPGPRATPTVRGEHVFFAAPNGLVGCLDAQTGAKRWTVNPKVDLGGQGTDFGASASPVVVDDVVLVPVGGATASLVALHVRTGSVVWKCGERPASYATPLPVRWRDRTLVVAPLQNSILLADAATGRSLFELKLSHGYDEHSAAPVYREPFLFLSAPFRSGGTLYEIIPHEDGCRCEQVWDTRQMSNDIASSVLVDGVIYGFDLKEPQARLNRPSRGEFRALDWGTGAVLWSAATPGHANVIAADGKLILFNDRGELLLLRQSRERCEELARAAIFQDEICWTAPALADGLVYLRTQTRAVCLDLRRERPVAALTKTLADIPQSRSFNPQRLLGGEREFPATPPDWAELGGWFAWNLAALAVGLLFCVCLHRRPVARESAFYGWNFLAGVCGGMLLNAVQSTYVFMLPLALWTVGQGAADVAVFAQREKSLAAAWQARGVMLLFVAVCGLYFHLCRRLGLSIEWSFLVGFLPGFPALIIAARAAGIRRPFARALSFSVYFWTSAAYILWRLTPGG